MYDWENNLIIADQLVEQVNSQNLQFNEKEGYYRTAVSKSYYACLNKVAELNEKHDCEPRKYKVEILIMLS